MAGEGLNRRFAQFLVVTSCWLACAHGRAEADPGERAAVLVAAARWTMLHFADAKTREDDSRTWPGHRYCLQIDEQPAPPEVIRQLRSQGLDVTGTVQDCLHADDPGRIVSMDGLTISGSEATIEVGIMLGEGGTMDLRRTGRDWQVVGIRRRWIAFEKEVVRCR